MIKATGNRQRTCKHCNDNSKKSHEGFIVGVNWVCSQECGYSLSITALNATRKRANQKAKQSQEKKERTARSKHRERKEKLKTAGDYLKEAQASINAYVRIRDYGKSCISCGSLPEQKYGGTMDCGHYRSRGAASHLRFNLFNMASQCVRCNRYKSGNAVDYRINLIKRIGIDRVERLESDNEPRKFTIEYLQRIKKIFNKKTKLYKRFRGV